MIEEKIKHPLYLKHNGRNDIALLKLASPANIMAINVKTICLPTLHKADIERMKYKNFTISGWGKSGKMSFKKRSFVPHISIILLFYPDNGTKSDTLLKSEVKLQDANQCSNSLATASYKVAVYEENICAGGYDKLHACRGSYI